MRIAFRTHAGMVRDQNEDFFSVVLDPNLSLVMVADGMGGHHGGEVASRLAVQVVRDFLISRLDHLTEEDKLAEAMRQAFLTAHLEITRRAEEDEGLAGMGTTMVLGLIRHSRLHLAHIGDSRAYLIRARSITCLTRDHSLVASMVESGLITDEEAKNHHLRNVITQCLGCPQYVGPDLNLVDLYPGDVLLFCSDGLTDMVDEQKILKIIRRNSRRLPVGAEKLVEKANRNGGRDNITVVMAIYNGDSA